MRWSSYVNMQGRLRSLSSLVYYDLQYTNGLPLAVGAEVLRSQEA
jgi:hypothetical protein